jgi:MFS family permease
VLASPGAVESTSRLGLLRRSPEFGLLAIATVGSSFGTYLAAIALTVHVYDQTESGIWVAALLIADFLPIVVIGILLGPLVDRLSRRKLMIFSDLARLAIFVGLVFVNDPAAIVALAGLAGVATGFFRPAVYAGLPNLVPDEELTNANSILQTIETLAWMVGPVVAGLMLTIWSPAVTYGINAVTFLISAVLVAMIAEGKLRSEESLTRGHWRDVSDGIRLVFMSPPLRAVLVVWNVALIGSAAINVAEIVFAKEELDAGNVGFGILVAASGVGLALGSYLAAPALGRVGLRRHYAGALVLMGVGAAGAALSPTLWIAIFFVIGAAAGNGAAIIANQLLVQRGAVDRYRGRALATIMSSNYAFLGLAMAAAGVLTDLYGARVVWFGAGIVYGVSAVVALAMTRWLPVRSGEDEEALMAIAESSASALVREPEPTVAFELEPPPELPILRPEPVYAPEPVTAPEPEYAPEPVSAPEPAPALASASSNDGAASHEGIERIASLMEEIERRRAVEASRRSSS